MTIKEKEAILKSWAVNGVLDLKGLDLTGLIVDLSGLKAKKIKNCDQKASTILNMRQKASNKISNSSQESKGDIGNSKQVADKIFNHEQIALRSISNNNQEMSNKKFIRIEEDQLNLANRLIEKAKKDEDNREKFIKISEVLKSNIEERKYDKAMCANDLQEAREETNSIVKEFEELCPGEDLFDAMGADK